MPTKTTLRGEKETSARTIRREKALRGLEKQLKRGTKTEKVAQLTLATTGANQVPLEEKDVKRINKEINILKQKV